MNDDFERKLAVALKTAVRESPPAVDVLVTPSRAPRRSRSRLTLATVVVVAVVVAVGGGWWALTGDPDRRTAPVVAASPDAAAGVCTASDVTVAPVDVAGGGNSLGIEVVAQQSCTLATPPTLTLAGRDLGAAPQTVPYAASATDRDDTTPWTPTRLEAGGRFSFSLTFAAAGISCPVSGTTVTVSAAVGGTPLTGFDWFIGCGGVTSGFVLAPHAAPADTGLAPCTAADVQVAAYTQVGTSDSGGPVGLVLSARGGRSCSLVDPPTVLVDSTLAPFWPSVDLSAVGDWQPRPLTPDRPIGFTVTHAQVPADCPPGGADHVVHVSIGGVAVADLPWAARDCGGVLVTVPR